MVNHRSARINAACELVDEAVDALEGPFSNLYFDSTVQRRPLVVKLEPSVITAIVFEWEVGVKLNITSLELLENAAETDPTGVKILSVETTSPDFTLDVNENSHLWMDHVQNTDEINRATIKIEPSLGSKILIEQKTQHAGIPVKLCVFVQSETGEAELIFDHDSLDKEFWEHLHSHRIRTSFPRVHRLVSGGLKSVFLQKYDQTRVPLGRIRKFFGEQTYQIFGNKLNERWLNARDHEYGQHGASNTFRFWSSQEKQTFLKDVKHLTRTLADNNIACIVCFGTLLGPVRDGDFIAHDDDADILCFNFDKEHTTNVFVTKLIEIGKQAGMKIVKVHDGKVFIRMFTPSGKSVDFFICDVENNKCHLHPAKHKPTDFDVIFPIQNGNILGVEVPFPNKPKDLLKDIYGEGWTEPAPFFVHEWRKNPK